MLIFEKLDLQLFADGGGEGGSGMGTAAPTGSSDGQAPGENNAVDAEQQRINDLLALGVPRDKIRANKKLNKQVAPAVSNNPEPVLEQAATKKPEPSEDTAPKRLTWDEIMQDPEYNKEMQKTIQKRYKKEHEFKDKLSPALELLGQHYGIDVSDMDKFDIDAFAKAVTEDNQFYEQKAVELGIPVESARRLEQLEREAARAKKEQEKTIQEQAVEQHLQGLIQQGEMLKKTFPDFDLRAELQNPTFARLTAPNSGLSVEDAYYAVHRAEIQQANKQQQVAAMQYTAQQTAQALSNSIQAGQRRPIEASPTQAASVPLYDYSLRNNRAERERIKAEIASAKARGAKVYPPGMGR